MLDVTRHLRRAAGSERSRDANLDDCEMRSLVVIGTTHNDDFTGNLVKVDGSVGGLVFFQEDLGGGLRCVRSRVFSSSHTLGRSCPTLIGEIEYKDVAAEWAL